MLSGCGDNNNANDTKEEVQDAMDDAGDAVDNAAEDMKDAGENMKENAEDQMQDAQDEVEEAHRLQRLRDVFPEVAPESRRSASREKLAGSLSLGFHRD